MLANGVKETTATTGTGTVTLAAVTGFVRFSQAFAVGEIVSYAIRDGNNWEWGIGTVAASNTLERTTCNAKFDAGSYVTDGTKLTLSGSAEVFCDLHKASAAEMRNGNIPELKTSGGMHYAGDITGTNLGAGAVTAGRTTFVPFKVGRRMTLTAIGFNVTTGAAATLGSAGIYANTVSGGFDVPGALLASASGLDTSTTGDKTGSVSLTLVPGVVYWAATKVDSASVQLRNISISSRDSGLGRLQNQNVVLTALIVSGSGSTLADPAGSPSSTTAAPPAVLLVEA